MYSFHSEASTASKSRRLQHIARSCVVLVILLTLATAVAQPAAAQSSDSSAANPICQDSSETLAQMIEGFVQITTAIGLMGLLVVWQADSLLEMFTMGHEKQAKIKEHKRGAMRSAGVLVVLGPLFTVAGSTMGLPIAQCVDLIPF